MSNNLVVPINISLSPKLPELNLVENLRLFMREDWMENRVSSLRPHRRSLLQCLAKTQRRAMVHNVYQAHTIRQWVLIGENMYMTRQAFTNFRSSALFDLNSCSSKPADFNFDNEPWYRHDSQ